MILWQVDMIDAESDYVLQYRSVYAFVVDKNDRVGYTIVETR